MSKLVNLTTLSFSGASAVTHIENLNYKASSVASLFSNCFYLKRISGKISTSGSSANSIFYRCHVLSDISGLTFEFKKDNGQPCITSATQAFGRCARATSAMLKKFLDACGSSLTDISNFVNMYGVDTTIENGVAVTRANAVIGTANDRANRDIPVNLFEKTPNITNMTSAFVETHYTTIPGALFDPVKGKLSNLNQTFCHMDKLVTVGKELLKNKSKLTNCYGTFAKCTALKNYLNEDPNIFEINDGTGAGTNKNESNVTTTNQMFYNANKLIVGSRGIAGLFDPLTKATTFEYMFCGCSSMSMALPNGLFSKNTALTKLDGIFGNCSGITSIPERLFRVNLKDTNELTKLTLARNMFSGCSGIKGTVNRNIFVGAPALADIGYGVNTAEVFSGGDNIGLSAGFFGNTNLEGYHEEFLFNTPKLTNVSRLFYHSSANGSLKYCYYTGTGGANVARLNTVSNKLFEKCTALQYSKATFCNNTGLTGHIPSNLFSNCKSTLIEVDYMFQGCTGLNGTDNDDNDISGLKNVGISNKWFSDAKSLSNVSGFLYGCTNFISAEIPEDLFKGCTSLAYVNDFFYNCQALSCRIPRGLFDSCRSTLRQVNSLFNNCRNLTGSIPTGVYTTAKAITGYEQVNKGTDGALQVVETVTDFSTQVSYEDVMLMSPNLYGSVLSTGNSYVIPVEGMVTKVKDGQYGFFANCLKLESASACFNECQKLTGSIPYDIFYTDSVSDRYLNLTNISSLFSRTLSLNKAYTDVTGVKYICNEDIFNKCPAITNINNLFYYMSGMEACNVYPNLFRNQTQITTASALFQFTWNLTGNVSQLFLSTCLSKLQYANSMFCSCNMTSVNQQFLNLGAKNTILRRVGCIFHGNFDQSATAAGGAGTSPAFWDTSMFPNIESSEAGYQHALAGCTKLTNYNVASTYANGAWVSGKSH